MSFLENTRKPNGFGGRLMVAMMNLGHRALAAWGFRFLSPLTNNAAILGCGCGGGANLRKLLQTHSHSRAVGIDYAAVSVEKARVVNRKPIAQGRCEVLRADVTKLPFTDARFDCVTAFETVYFWSDFAQSLAEVRRVLKPGGMLLICNECGGERAGDFKWTDKIPGMTVYNAAELSAALKQAGFGNIQIHKHQKGWLCVTAEKSAASDR